MSDDDARAFTIPDPVEVENYLIWRQKDAVRNSISSLAQSHFSAKDLHGKKREDMLRMLIANGTPWSEQATHVQRGTAIVRGEGGWVPDFQILIFTEDREWMSAHLQPAIREATGGTK